MNYLSANTEQNNLYTTKARILITRAFADLPMTYFNWNEVQSVHSTIVGFDSWVPTSMADREQKSSSLQ